MRRYARERLVLVYPVPRQENKSSLDDGSEGFAGAILKDVPKKSLASRKNWMLRMPRLETPDQPQSRNSRSGCRLAHTAFPYIFTPKGHHQEDEGLMLSVYASAALDFQEQSSRRS
jgi:hypothetical protein